MRRRYRPPMTGAQRARVFCFFLAVVLITLGVVGTVHLRGLLGNLAETAVSNMVGQVVTEAVSDTIANGDIRFVWVGEVAERDLVIPLGTLTGSALLAGRGPGFTVRMQSVGSCSARFENRFSQAGINQTTHRIILCVEVNMSILLPGFQTSTQVDASFSVAETVIVGDVPESYTYFDSGNPIEEDALEYTMNNG